MAPTRSLPTPDRIALAAGSAGLVLAAALVWAPGAVSSFVPTDAFDDATGGVAAGVVGGCVLAALGVAVTIVHRRESAADSPAPDAGSAAHSSQGRAARFDEHVRAVMEADRPAARSEIRAELAAVAVTTIVAVEDVDRSVAEARVASGAWTDDPVAAATVVEGDGPPLPLSWRLYGWLLPDRASRNAIERCVAAIERYDGGAQP